MQVRAKPVKILCGVLGIAMADYVPTYTQISLGPNKSKREKENAIGWPAEVNLES